MRNTISQWIVLGLLVAALFLAGCVAPTLPTDQAMTGPDAMEKKDTPNDTMEKTDPADTMEKDSPNVMEKDPVSDTIMTKGVTRYTKAAFENALASGKPVVVNVHANWCPICNAFAPHFDQVATTFSDDVIFLQAHWQDEETTDDDRAFFAERGVSGQHTLILFNPTEVKRSRESFNAQSFEAWVTQ